MKQIKVKIFSDFCGSDICKKNFERTCKVDAIENYGIGKEIYITCDEDYTHAVILNKAMPNLTIDKKNVLGLACEPLPFLSLTPQFIEYAKKHIGKYFIGDKSDLGEPFLEHHGFMWFEHPFSNKKIEKKKTMSIVFSEKNSAPGHKYRFELVSQIINNNLPVDIYGRGCNLIPDHIRNVKGIFDKTEPYDDYIFTIAVENFCSNEYFSEKIMTPIMCETIPIYLGCKNVERSIGDRYIELSGRINEDIELIKKILENPDKYAREIKTTKDYIFDNLNFIKKIEKIFSSS